MSRSDSYWDKASGLSNREVYRISALFACSVIILILGALVFVFGSIGDPALLLVATACFLFGGSMLVVAFYNLNSKNSQVELSAELIEPEEDDDNYWLVIKENIMLSLIELSYGGAVSLGNINELRIRIDRVLMDPLQLTKHQQDFLQSIRSYIAHKSENEKLEGDSLDQLVHYLFLGVPIPGYPRQEDVGE